MESLRIVALLTFAAVGYGLVLDQITVRICVEYFTIGHPRIVPTENPTLVALAWGVVATWWAGLGAGVLVAVASRWGSWPKRTAASLVRPVVVLIGVMAFTAVISGIAGNRLASRGYVWLREPLAMRVPVDVHVRFLTDLWVRSASYVVGFLGTVVLSLAVVASRWRGRGA